MFPILQLGGRAPAAPKLPSEGWSSQADIQFPLAQIFRCTLILFICGCLRALASDPATKTNAADEFFRNGPIPHVKIQITGTNLTALQRENRKYARCTVREGDKLYEDVAVHL